MSVTNQYMCEYAQIDRRSVPAQLRGNGDGRADLYELFLRMEGVKNSLVERNGDVVDTYSAAMSGTKLTPALAWLLVRLNRLLVKLESLNTKLSEVASKYDIDSSNSDDSDGRGIRSHFRPGSSLCTPAFASVVGLRG
ncbi:hypothetical protein [Paraburkholderia humisilvae]|uniref:Uncharacterized protein n=1 Tax=Paraburkholderia humisilvae TaxID=627669 RepID=A0A6J5DM40_9BURK|nr:hypothetical protein [Paraburkholderia humisilvae]CAB3753916.1 hypothetical protein LMG29542_02188 [Paraburkholderia humisilvae]